MSSPSVSYIDSESTDGYLDEEDRIIQQEWEESMQQLQLLVSTLLLPFFGKWLGRKTAHWAYARYIQLGFTRRFFSLGAA